MESNILKQKKQLSDGSYGKIFVQTSETNATYICRLCSFGGIVDDRSLTYHIKSEKHKKRMNENF